MSTQQLWKIWDVLYPNNRARTDLEDARNLARHHMDYSRLQKTIVDDILNRAPNIPQNVVNDVVKLAILAGPKAAKDIIMRTIHDKYARPHSVSESSTHTISEPESVSSTEVYDI
jgi:hypothetical protein